MTDYQKMYQEKLTTPDKIAQQVQSGWLLGMDTATSQTPAIMTAIAERIRNSDITGVKVQALLDAYPFEFYTDPTLAGKMTGYSWFSSSAARIFSKDSHSRPSSLPQGTSTVKPRSFSAIFSDAALSISMGRLSLRR